MILDIEGLLPKDIIKIINELNILLEKQENSKSIICTLINKERENACCPKCESQRIKKNGKYKLVKTVWGIDTNSAEVKISPGRTYYFKVRAFYFAHIENVDKNYYSKYSAAVKLETK